MLPKIVIMTPSDELEMWKMLTTGHTTRSRPHGTYTHMRRPGGPLRREEVAAVHQSAGESHQKL